MVRLKWLDVALIGGGVIITAVGIAVLAKAAAKPPPEEEIPPPPEEGIPAIPATIEFSTYPSSLSQFYGFYYTMPTPVSLQTLCYKALTSFVGPPYPEGIRTERATLRVLDAAGRGVPNVAVLIWSSQTRDDQSGQLSINDATRSEVEALRILTDANGEISLLLTYELSNIKMLEDRNRFGCCLPVVGRIFEIDVGGVCAPIEGLFICYQNREARTDAKAYTINARIEGTVKSSLFIVACQAVGKALWA